MAPLIEEIRPAPDVARALHAFANLPGVILFDSARAGDPRSRYSFLAADPIEFTTFARAEPGSDPFARLRSRLGAVRAETIPGLPPFQGGMAGMLGYELGRCWERLPSPLHDELELPVLAVGLYDWVIAWDHAQGRAWIVSHGWPETETRAKERRAAARRDEVKQRLLGVGRVDNPSYAPSRIPLQSAQHPLGSLPGLASNFSREGYLRAVERVVEYIRAGDIFQANLSQRLMFPADEPPIDLYLRLRERNAAPFAGYFAHDDWAILSASPERFLNIAGDVVSTRPIKGTRQRRSPPEADLFTQDELHVSPKDVAENVMIVDLLRNDLSKVCRPGSLRVPQLCGVETYETVHHLVSEVRGELEAGRDAWDVLAAAFPGGSITGAPKVRAMEIITELEQVARGPYCGSLFYVGCDGAMDSSILIRTITHHRGWLQLPAGGGIVAQSDPAAEYEETLHKAEGMVRALRP
jgi:para-aminobenzoate synthetase component 1